MKLPTREELLDLWLVKYHNITAKEVAEKYPEEGKSSKWFELFPCTQEQSDEWVKEAKQLFRKKYKVSKWMLEKGWPLIFLDCAPYVKREDNDS